MSFRFKGITYSNYNPPVGVGCTYPLDADTAELSGEGLTIYPTISDGSQTVSFNITSGLGAVANYGAGPSGFSNDTAPLFDLWTTGERAVELQIQSMPAIDEGFSLEVSNIRMSFFAETTLAETELLRVRWMADGTYDIAFLGVDQVTGLVTPPTAVGFVVDNVNNEVFMVYGGTEYGRTSAAAFNAYLLLQSVEQTGIPGTHAGKTMTARVETNAANMLETYEAGTLDKCGNTI